MGVDAWEVVGAEEVDIKIDRDQCQPPPLSSLDDTRLPALDLEPIGEGTTMSHSSLLVSPLPNSPAPVVLVGVATSLDTSNSIVLITPPKPSHLPLPSACSHLCLPPPLMTDCEAPSTDRRLRVVAA